ncbi:hypothetical protein Fcan01_23664 [Folsomia candida]|uniref:Gustatory receptor n=1 Tax=Folsomia candida TaxID=158441 RepID=A0A226D8P7_FOLCA|nr:hypothetical protein Fcan01_23664 [Folsomia candida]
MFTTELLSLLKFHLQVCHVFRCISFKYGKKSDRFIRTRNLQIVQFQRVLSILYFTSMFLNICLGATSLVERFQGLNFLALYFMCVVTRWDVKLGNSDLQIINTFLDFEANVMKDLSNLGLSLVLRLIKLLVAICELSLLCLPILQFVLLLYAPCMSPFTLSMLPNCEHITLSGHWLVVVWIHVFETWMSYHMVFSVSVGIVYSFFVNIVCLLSYHRILEREIGKIRDTHDMKNCLKLYRQIQVLEKSLNAVLKDSILPSFVLGAPLIQIVSMFVCINLHEEIEMPGFVMFPMMWLDAIWANVFVFTLASCIHNVSKKLLQEIKNTGVWIENEKRLMKREMVAMSRLKIKFGSNFIDRTTPLTIQNFCWSRTMTLTLIWTKRRR